MTRIIKVIRFYSQDINLYKLLGESKYCLSVNLEKILDKELFCLFSLLTDYHEIVTVYLKHLY